MFYDIYGLSTQRDAVTVERFLNHFCDRAQLEPLVDTWLQVWPNEKYQTPEVERPLHSIAELLAYAVANPSHAFVFYNQKGLRDDVTCMILQFTYDAKVVFGISIETNTVDGTDTYAQAITVEAEIRHITGATKSYIAAEYPPAQDEEEFDADITTWQNGRSRYRADGH